MNLFIEINCSESLDYGESGRGLCLCNWKCKPVNITAPARSPPGGFVLSQHPPSPHPPPLWHHFWMVPGTCSVSHHLTLRASPGPSARWGTHWGREQVIVAVTLQGWAQGGCSRNNCTLMTERLERTSAVMPAQGGEGEGRRTGRQTPRPTLGPPSGHIRWPVAELGPAWRKQCCLSAVAIPTSDRGPRYPAAAPSSEWNRICSTFHDRMKRTLSFLKPLLCSWKRFMANSQSLLECAVEQLSLLFFPFEILFGFLVTECTFSSHPLTP